MRLFLFATNIRRTKYLHVCLSISILATLLCWELDAFSLPPPSFSKLNRAHNNCRDIRSRSSITKDKNNEKNRINEQQRYKKSTKRRLLPALFMNNNDFLSTSGHITNNSNIKRGKEHYNVIDELVLRSKKLMIGAIVSFLSFAITVNPVILHEGVSSVAWAAPNTVTTSTTSVSSDNKNKYWTIMSQTTQDYIDNFNVQQQQQDDNDSGDSIIRMNTVIDNRRMKVRTNEQLVDYVVATVNSMYYDNTGGAYFNAREFHYRWKELRDYERENEKQYIQDHFASLLSPSSLGTGTKIDGSTDAVMYPTNVNFATREGAVNGIKWLVSSIDDPFSKYLTRDELKQELATDNCNGFLGTGAIVELPTDENGKNNYFTRTVPTIAAMIPDKNNESIDSSINNKRSTNTIVDANRVINLPVVTAVAPYSIAERNGIVVGDRIVAVDDTNFIDIISQTQSNININIYKGVGSNKLIEQQQRALSKAFQPFLVAAHDVASNKKGAVSLGQDVEQSIITVAKPVYRIFTTSEGLDRELVVGYRSTRIKLLTTPTSPTTQPQKMNKLLTLSQPTDTIVTDHTAATTTASATTSATAVSSSLEKTPTTSIRSVTVKKKILGGNSIVHYELIGGDRNDNNNKDSSFVGGGTEPYSLASSSSSPFSPSSIFGSNEKVGYVRLTRFSKQSTKGYIDAIKQLEKAGAESYIIDLRNNYGGVVQEAMLTASTLIRDPHAVLCYTLNVRGEFTPNVVEDYVNDKRYPGYFLSKKESKNAAYNQLKHENAKKASDSRANWTPSSSFVSLHEQTITRGIHRASLEETNMREYNNDYQLNTVASSTAGTTTDTDSNNKLLLLSSSNNKFGSGSKTPQFSQKKIVILINEGTASSAELFASALHENGRLVALVGTKSYGKGLIQHTFPLPDGGGLRLTVAEYLTPSLHHVTNVGDAKFDQMTGELVGGGVHPEVYCDNRHGINNNDISADLCVGTALDVLEAASSRWNGDGSRSL